MFSFRRSWKWLTYYEQVRDVVLQTKLATLMLSALHIEVIPLNAKILQCQIINNKIDLMSRNINQGEISGKPSTGGTSMCWARSISGKLQCSLRRVESRSAPFCSPGVPLTTNCREKKQRKERFDVVKAVHEAEYSNLKRPIDPKTKRPIEPAHKFEVTIEGDSISQRK
jgi:hypothetical protein